MDYIINLNKPKGLSSHDAVQKVKSILGISKAGHSGTLDPSATGVLLICCNRSTKISGFLSDFDKEYVTTLRLGIETDTMDIEGNVLKEMNTSHVTELLIEETFKKYTGLVMQTPPMFSAIKYNGTPLYKYARKGITVERRRRPVYIYDIKLVQFNNPFLTLSVSCGKGTYIRSLCSDISECMGTCGHVHSLVRTKIGQHNINNSIDLNRLINYNNFPLKLINVKGFYSIDFMLSHLDEIYLTPEEVNRIMNGNVIKNNTLLTKEYPLRLKDSEGRLIGIGVRTERGIKKTKTFINVKEFLKQSINFC